MDALRRTMFRMQVPDEWVKRSWSAPNLAVWLAEFSKRSEWIRAWLNNIAPPATSSQGMNQPKESARSRAGRVSARPQSSQAHADGLQSGAILNPVALLMPVTSSSPVGTGGAKHIPFGQLFAPRAFLAALRLEAIMKMNAKLVARGAANDTSSASLLDWSFEAHPTGCLDAAVSALHALRG